MSTTWLDQQKGAPVFWRDSQLPFEVRQTFDSTACYRKHTHPTLSVGIIDQGRSLLSLPGRQLELKAGDVMTIWPREVHACNPQPSSRWSYRMFYLDWDWVQSTAPAGASWATDTGIQQLLHTREATGLINRMTTVVVQHASSTEKIRRMRECLTDLYKLATQHPAMPVKPIPNRESLVIRRAREYIEAHAPETINLRKLASDAGLTSFQFIRKFGREVGLTPHAYQLDQRIIQARELLKHSRSQVDVAYALGFSDQSHFQRVFKPRVAATPGQYRMANQAKRPA